jgi:hypothetical protein
MEIIHTNQNGGIFISDGYLTVALLSNRAQGKPSGLNHFGIQIDDAEEIYEKLAEFDISRPEERPGDRPYAEVRTTDPDGNNFDLSVHGFQKIETPEDRKAGKLEKV